MADEIEQPAHGLRGPHFTDEELPAEFVPLRLELRAVDPEAPSKFVQVARPSAVVGRHSEADVVLASPEVSRRHCRLAFHDGCWHLTDLDSLNGVFLNGERIHEAVLHDGDSIRTGSVTFSVLSSRKVQTHPWTDVLQSIAGSLDAQ